MFEMLGYNDEGADQDRVNDIGTSLMATDPTTTLSWEGHITPNGVYYRPQTVGKKPESGFPLRNMTLSTSSSTI